jgi:hypothetical protein
VLLVSPTLIRYIHCFLLSSNYILGSSLLPLPHHRCRYCPSCTHPFPSGQSSEVLSECTLKLFSVRSFRTNGGCHPLTLEFEQEYHVYICDLSIAGEGTWWAVSSHWLEYSDVSSSRTNDIIHRSLNFPSFHKSRDEISFKGEGCNTPWYGNLNQVTLVAIKS